MTTPCNGCADRCLGCNAACARFAAYKDDLKAAAEYLHRNVSKSSPAKSRNSAKSITILKRCRRPSSDDYEQEDEDEEVDDSDV